MDLDPENNFIDLGFEYTLLFDKYVELRQDWREFDAQEVQKKIGNKQYKPKELYGFLNQKQIDYFKVYQKSIEIGKDSQRVNNGINTK